MVRYSVLRILLFFGFFALFVLVGLKGLWLLLAAALASMAVSFVLLSRFRQDFSAQLAAKVDAKARRAHQNVEARQVTADEAVEDAIVDGKPRRGQRSAD